MACCAVGRSSSPLHTNWCNRSSRASLTWAFHAEDEVGSGHKLVNVFSAAQSRGDQVVDLIILGARVYDSIFLKTRWRKELGTSRTTSSWAMEHTSPIVTGRVAPGVKLRFGIVRLARERSEGIDPCRRVCRKRNALPKTVMNTAMQI